MATQSTHYPIGKANTPWGEAEKQQWLAAQSIKRSYANDVLEKLDRADDTFVRTQYGELSHNPQRYPLYAFTSKDWQANKPSILVTGGVHGYETSGVQGAIDFLLNHTQAYAKTFNIIVAPCISPWGYETINRWNPSALDPNRSFYANSPSEEASAIMSFVSTLDSQLLAHIDLHETTDTDNSEFRPALAARDGIELHDWGIPDGFYTVADSAKPQLDFQQAIIKGVQAITHIAPADDEGKIIGADVVSEGVICYDKSSLFLCAGFTGAPYVTTTEVYPDSPSANAQICIDAQVAAIKGALDYLVENNK